MVCPILGGCGVLSSVSKSLGYDIGWFLPTYRGQAASTRLR